MTLEQIQAALDVEGFLSSVEPATAASPIDQLVVVLELDDERATLAMQMAFLPDEDAQIEHARLLQWTRSSTPSWRWPRATRAPPRSRKSGRTTLASTALGPQRPGSAHRPKREPPYQRQGSSNCFHRDWPAPGTSDTVPSRWGNRLRFVSPRV
jgi:hypothetical protein